LEGPHIPEAIRRDIYKQYEVKFRSCIARQQRILCRNSHRNSGTEVEKSDSESLIVMENAPLLQRAGTDSRHQCRTGLKKKINGFFLRRISGSAFFGRNLRRYGYEY
jgi:hypothetical protein